MKKLQTRLRRILRADPLTHNNTNERPSSTNNEDKEDSSGGRAGTIYRPLNSNLREIRLLKAHNKENLTDESSPLVLSLHTKSLLDFNSYIALSYVWGDPQLSEPITCNGQRLLITKNLEQALRTVFCAVRQQTRTEISEADEDIYLWADGICINQMDNKEKAEQVALMRDIYSVAVGAFGYIGAPEMTDPSTVLAFLESLDGRQEDTCSGSLDLSISHPSVLAYCELWTQSWFNRSWVFQEMVLSKNMICLYGKVNNYSMWTLEYLDCVATGYRNMAGAHKQITLPRHLASTIQSNEDRVLECGYLKREIESTTNLNPVDILAGGRASNSGDLRDKVWSRLGILGINQLTAPLPHPDYSSGTSAVTVYTDFAINSIQNGYGIDILAHSGTSQRISKLPTWAPDWSCNPRHPLYYRLYSFTKSTASSIEILDCTKITVRGAIFDEIAILARPCGNIGELLIPACPEIQTSESLALALEQMAWEITAILRQSSEIYVNHDSWDEVIWRTLTGDVEWGGRAGAKMRESFDAFRTLYHSTGISPYSRSIRDFQSKSKTKSEEMTTDVYDHRSARDSSLPDSSKSQPSSQLPLSNADIESLRAKSQYYERLSRHIQNGRVLGVTRSGFMGVFPNDARVGDVWAALLGSPVPFILRRVPNPGGMESKERETASQENHQDAEIQYQIVGPCYLHGIMDGGMMVEAPELEEGWTPLKGNWKDLVIV